ncbi:GMC family oxidoreductase [uncultured Fibrella sp.]|uniref:GMC family oxidoreductase n=1 Tax=uncultured Fibrella sp. TaxID=1284596 RepID=UPI0035CA5150
MDISAVWNTQFDLCIVGSGPSGLIVALEYSRLNPGKQVIIVEYGIAVSEGPNALDDSITVSNKKNHHEPYECTNKGLGGTSATWGGRCVMYDKIDFLDRPILNGGCTWNTDIFNEIQSYLPQAAAYFECGNPIFNIHEIPDFTDKRIAANFVEDHVTDSVLERWSMPTRFASRYSRELDERENLTTLLGYECRDIIIDSETEAITAISIRNIETSSVHLIKSRLFVLSAGTQETTRILLRNPQVFSSLANVPTSLGKYYQGHLSGKIASIKFTGDPEKTDYGFLKDSDGVYIRRRFQFTDRFLLENNLLNTAIWLDNPLYFDPKHRSGPMSFMYLAMITPILGKKLAPPAIAQSITKGKIFGISKHLINILIGLPKSLYVPAIIFFKRYLSHRKLPGVFLFSPENKYALHFHSEQLPDISNRMELGEDRESLTIHYSISEQDINSVIVLHKALDSWLRRTGAGELEYWYSENELHKAISEMSKDGIHQSGTTRIANSPEEGVVDSRLKVWGTDNLYICSSSVFPTSSQANPTFLLGAFAVRLANDLTYAS